MFSLICRQEWKNITLDRTLALLLSLFLICAAYAAFTGGKWYRTREQEISGLRSQIDNERRNAIDDLTAIETGRQPKTALGDCGGTPCLSSSLPYTVHEFTLLPPTVLAPLSLGLDDLYPYKANVKQFNLLTNDVYGDMFDRRSVQNPAVLATGRFDFSFVLVYIVPLLILAFTYNVLSAEREQGTLVLILSQPVRAGRLIAAKLLVRGVAITLPILIVTAAGIVAATGTIPDTYDAVLLGLILLAVLAYCIFWLSASAAVNALNRNSATNALAMGSLWAFTVLVIPTLLNLTVQIVKPVPSRGTLENQLRANYEAVRERGDAVLQAFYRDHPDWRPHYRVYVQPYTLVSYAVVHETDRISLPLVEQFNQRVEAQRQIVDRLSFLSPAILLQNALDQASGNGPDRNREFYRQSLAFLAKWKSFTTPRMFHGINFTASDYRWIPRFTFHDESLMSATLRLFLESSAIFIWAVVAIALAMQLLKRFSVAG